MTQQTNNINIQRLAELAQKVNANSISASEKDEYMRLLYENGSINEKHYQSYLQGRNQEQIFKTGLAIGGIILLGYLLDKALSK